MVKEYQNDAEFIPKSAEDERKENRNRKWELIAGAIGDGVSAFSNLIFASKGAPNMQTTSLVESIKRKHSAQDAEYGKRLSAWEKEQEKIRKESERQAKRNARENIHPNFNPLQSHWNDKEYIGVMYDDLLSEVASKNKKLGKSSSPLYEHLKRQIEMTPKNVQPYLQQSILYDVLDGKLELLTDDYKGEIDEGFLDTFRNKWKENDESWVKMK